MKKSNTALVPFTTQFSGRDITTVFYRGRPCWMAKDIGRALGYGNDGQKLAQRITQDWANEFIEETDFAVIKGENLVSFKTLLEAIPESGIAYASHVLVLFETGLNLVCIKTRKAAGQHLRRWLASEVLPQIRETGSYSIKQPVAARPSVGAAAQRQAIAAAREERLSRQMRCRELHRLAAVLKKAGHVNENVVVSMQIAAAEAVLDDDFAALRPPTEDTWISPTEIAKRIGTTPARVGRIITELGLRGNIDGLSRGIVNKARHSDRTVVSYVYSPEAVAQIRQAWGGLNAA
jgi:prophage antirepressor-like protein